MSSLPSVESLNKKVVLSLTVHHKLVKQSFLGKHEFAPYYDAYIGIIDAKGYRCLLMIKGDDMAPKELAKVAAQATYELAITHKVQQHNVIVRKN